MYGTDERHALLDAARAARERDEANAAAFDAAAQARKNAQAVADERALQARIRATMRLPAA